MPADYTWVKYGPTIDKCEPDTENHYYLLDGITGEKAETCFCGKVVVV